MSAYLQSTDTDYVREGVQLTPSLILRASSLIDSYCKREIGMKGYKERISLNESLHGHLSYFPVKEVVSVKGRLKHGLVDNFFGTPSLADISTDSVDVNPDTGAIRGCCSAFGIPYVELEVTYNSGWEPIPEKVKVACGMLVEQLSATINPNVKSMKDVDSSIEYFGNKLITEEIESLLSEYRLFSYR